MIKIIIDKLFSFFLAYRIEPIQGLFHKYEENLNDEERLANNLYNFKQLEESNSDNYYPIPCQSTSSSSYILCKKLEHLSRRDTGFLRFGRKR